MYIMSGFAIDIFPSKLGGGLPGAQPSGGLLGGGAGPTGGSGMEGGSTRGRDRIILRQAFGNDALLARLLPGHSPIIATNAIITPFRAAFNAGDVNGTINSAPLADLPAVNQVNGIGPSQLHAYSNGVRNDGNAAFSGNPRYVYDSSNYVTFKKLQAKNRNYNDKSFGGANNGAYVPLMHVRH